MEKKTIVARAEVLKGKEEEFIDKAQKLVMETRSESGNISYTLFQCPENPIMFIFYEEYKDQNAIDAHASSKHFNTFSKEAKDLLAKDLIIEFF